MQQRSLPQEINFVREMARTYAPNPDIATEMENILLCRVELDKAAIASQENLADKADEHMKKARSFDEKTVFQFLENGTQQIVPLKNQTEDKPAMRMRL